MAENSVVPHPRRHGMYINFSNDSVWVPGTMDPKHRNISVLQGLPIQVLPPGLTPPSSPAPSPSSVATCHQISSLWEQREEQDDVVNHLKTWDMHTTPVHPGMGCPDTPGLEEETSVDSLLEEDLLTIATTLKKHH